MTTGTKAMTRKQGLDLMIADLEEYCAENTLGMGSYEYHDGSPKCGYGVLAAKAGFRRDSIDETGFCTRQSAMESRYDGAVHGLSIESVNDGAPSNERNQVVIAYLKSRRAGLE